MVNRHSAEMLELRHLNAFYGQSHVLHGLDLVVAPGEIVALLGRNGSGRSTTARAVMGLVACTGEIRWRGRSIIGLKPYEIARLGLGYVPENRDVFPTLTVHQNLVLGQKPGHRAGRWDFEAVYARFPHLRERQQVAAGLLSGGEQQMLTLARTLMGDPDLLIIDEPTEGLAPQIVTQVAQALMDLKARGVSVLLIEQKLTMALAISDRVVVVGHGRAVFDDTPEALRQSPDVRREWLEV